VPKILLVLNRYFSIAVTVLNTYALTINSTDHFCNVFVSHLVLTTGVVQIHVVQLILAIRIFALYPQNRVLKAAVLTCWGASFIVAATLSETSAEFFIGGLVDNSPSFTGCGVDQAPSKLWPFWVPIIVFETVAVLLAGSKTIGHLKESKFVGSQTYGVLQIMLRDSMLYFSTIFVLYILNAVLWQHNSDNFLTVFTGPTVCFSSVLGSRMLLNIRKELADPRSDGSSSGRSGSGARLLHSPKYY